MPQSNDNLFDSENFSSKTKTKSKLIIIIKEKLVWYRDKLKENKNYPLSNVEQLKRNIRSLIKELNEEEKSNTRIKE